ncbi:hypothetical protein FZEAL_3698 [Fusarium zealandicum]|uniref:Uncharacterized protein n=1 Tax=Fusarium zealandicum TaxID=1053134 RepID=A0A8H4XMB3_9HYPO|nr:hypothetical protein FZEAL_3698 [Fusarium zealandicum]
MATELYCSWACNKVFKPPLLAAAPIHVLDLTPRQPEKCQKQQQQQQQQPPVSSSSSSKVLFIRAMESCPSATASSGSIGLPFDAIARPINSSLIARAPSPASRDRQQTP